MFVPSVKVNFLFFDSKKIFGEDLFYACCGVILQPKVDFGKSLFCFLLF